MMKRWISMLLALMLLMLGMATAENSADDAWEYELVGRAIELVRQMDAQERGRLFEDTLNITEVACTETPQPIDRGMPSRRSSASASTARTSRRRCCFLC